MDQSFEGGIADRPHRCRETVLMMAHSQCSVEHLFRRVTYLTIHKEYFLVHLSKSFSEALIACCICLGQETPYPGVVGNR